MGEEEDEVSCSVVVTAVPVLIPPILVAISSSTSRGLTLGGHVVTKIATVVNIV